MLQGEILHYVQTPQLLAHVLNSHALDALKETNINHRREERGRSRENRKLWHRGQHTLWAGAI